MKKPAVAVILALLLVITGLSAWFLLSPKQQGGTLARITLDGVVVDEIDLSALARPYCRTVTGKSGLSNTIRAEDGRIWVDHADCPDQVCVRQGPISQRSVPIVCLPNQLVIEIVGGGSGLDAATG